MVINLANKNKIFLCPVSVVTDNNKIYHLSNISNYLWLLIKHTKIKFHVQCLRVTDHNQAILISIIESLTSDGISRNYYKKVPKKL